ncbi:MAG: hypothetical protein K0S39_3943 [Paenibacillus sp.]|nr:hypothetical protein [Paenibacillus sp.]
MKSWNMVLLEKRALEDVKSASSGGNPGLEEAYRKLKESADQSLLAGPFTVMNKSFVPSSGNKHDYVSMGPYWWPNPDTRDGLPYIRRDGERNPEIERFDSAALKQLEDHVRKLALGYFLLEDERYAAHAVRLLRDWFVEPETRMNPHLNYGQMIPGICEGRCIGLIETRYLGLLMDYIALLVPSPSWNTGLEAGLLEWFNDYLHWLLNNPIALEEENWHNNHGTYYDVQTASLALHTGDRATAERLLKLAANRRFFSHIEPDGRQPHELERTLSMSYSLMNLTGMFDLARLGESAGLDLWHVQSSDGRSLRAAVDFLEPYCAGRKEWPYQQIKQAEPERVFTLFRRAANVYGDARYELVAERAYEQGEGCSLLGLIYPAVRKPH